MTLHGLHRLPKQWPKFARAAVLHAVSLASSAMTLTRARLLMEGGEATAREDELAALQDEVALLQEELRIKDKRMGRLLPCRRPHYCPMSRMTILELRARRGWSMGETARRLLIEPRTISSWMKRLDDGGERALVETASPVNKFPEFVRYVVRRLKVLCPTMGKRKIAEVLARAGLHLGATTVRRMTQETGLISPGDGDEGEVAMKKTTIIARGPHHVWGVDLTVVPMQAGFWTMLSPFAWLQRWPFCYWVAVVVDHFSRRAVGFAVFRKAPSAEEVTAMLDRAIAIVGTAPRSTITDQGKQFFCDAFKAWCKSHGIRPRFGAVGKHGSIAVVERFIQSMKEECIRRIIVPMSQDRFREELALYFYWFNGHRPHKTLLGRTPDEKYLGRMAASERWRWEPRPNWPESSGCAAPLAELKGRPGARLRLKVQFLGGRRHRPVVTLRKVA